MLAHKYTQLCDFARPELGSKWIVIGLYPNSIIFTPQLPLPLQSLTFFQVFESDAPGTIKFKGTLSRLDTGEVIAAFPPIQMQIAPGIFPMPISLGNLVLSAFGPHTWSLDVEGQAEPFVTNFEVKHQPLQMAPFAMPGWKR